MSSKPKQVWRVKQPMKSWIRMEECTLTWFDQSGRHWPRGKCSYEYWERQFISILSPRTKKLFFFLWNHLARSVDDNEIWCYVEIFILLPKPILGDLVQWAKQQHFQTTTTVTEYWEDLIVPTRVLEQARKRKSWNNNTWHNITELVACNVKNSTFWNNEELDKMRASYIAKKGPQVAHTVCVVDQNQLQTPEVKRQETATLANTPFDCKLVPLSGWIAMEFAQFAPDELLCSLSFCDLILDLAWANSENELENDFFRDGFVESGSLETYGSKLPDILIDAVELQQAIGNMHGLSVAKPVLQSLRVETLKLVCLMCWCVVWVLCMFSFLGKITGWLLIF